MAEEMRTELRAGAPDPHLLESLRQLAAASQAADGAPPYSEQTLVELGKDRGNPQQAPLTIACAWQGEDLVAAAAVIHEHSDDDGEHTLTELTVHPQHRQQGIGTMLAQKLLTHDLASARSAAGTGVSHRAWAHGGHPGGPRLASAFRWEPVRELWRMRLDNDAQLPAVELDERLTLDTFRPGTDEQAWLSANAEAFIDHPEQGQLTMEDLQARMTEDWFDPEGFFLAWSAESGDSAEPQLLGFHWTKMPEPERPGDEQLGEVYAVGVLPAAQGRGLGASLTLAGIEHLRSRGADAVILYVDASNASAAALYKKLGFRVWDVDVQYAPSADTGVGSA